MTQGTWKTANNVDLVGLEDRLSSDKRVVTAWFPDRGACYMIVDSKSPYSRKHKPKVVY